MHYLNYVHKYCFVGKSQMLCNLRGVRFWVVGSNYALDVEVNYILFSLSSITMCR